MEWMRKFRNKSLKIIHCQTKNVIAKSEGERDRDSLTFETENLYTNHI